jgi:hypothetical protein
MKCNSNVLKEVRRLLKNPPGRIKLENVYIARIGRKQGQDIWVVNGARVHQLLYPYFLAGGNDQRYRYTPDGDVWIDSRMGLLEVVYTIEHELLERKLMRERGWTYNRAHNAALAYEERLRLADERKCARQEERAAALWAPLWRQSALALGSYKRHSIYRAFFRTVGGLKVWLVDGTEIRRMLDGNFLYAGNDLNASYIPDGEIWLDLNLATEEFWFTLTGELADRKARAAGAKGGKPGKISLAAQVCERRAQELRAHRHELGLSPVRYGCRDRGAKK